MSTSETQSSTLVIPSVHAVPQHIAVIMDGNGRWANARHLPRMVGHERGVAALRQVVEACMRRGVRYLSVFAFSSENWRRPADEVSVLMRLFLNALEREIDQLQSNGIRLRVVGDLTAFEPRLRELIADGEARSAAGGRMTLTVAANYGGRWDILQAAQAALREHPELARQPEHLDEGMLSPHLAMAYAPEPDLFIRTGGEQRISNFLLWQAAYAELFFTDDLWPDFKPERLREALTWFAGRDRRFGSSAPL